MRLTRFGICLVVLVLVTAVVSILAPTAGLAMAIVLAVVALVALSDGLLSTGAEAGHEAWARVEAERKQESLRGRR